MSCASDKIYDLMFGTYGKKFKGRPSNYWLLTDNEKRKEYTGDSLVRQDVSPAFFCEFSDVYKRQGFFILSDDLNHDHRLSRWFALTL